MRGLVETAFGPDRDDLIDRIEVSTQELRAMLSQDGVEVSVLPLGEALPAVAVAPDQTEKTSTIEPPTDLRAPADAPDPVTASPEVSFALADADILEKGDFHFADCGCADCCFGLDEFPLEGADGGGAATTGTDADPPTFTLDQIADQLTFGYWSSTSGGGERSFDVGPGGSLNVDITGLQPTGQALAREALDAWTAVTGITFVEVAALPSPSVWRTEGGDAPISTTTPYSIAVGEGFRGTLATNGDRDAVAVQLVAGQSYTLALRGDDGGGNPLFDPYLRVLNSSGSIVAQNDDAESYDSRLTFTAGYTGSHYIQAGAFNDSYSGDYTIQIADAAEDVHMTFGDQASGAYAQSSFIGSTLISSFINVNQNWTGGENRIDGYHYQTYLHEIGHALGLGHAGNYNGGASFGTDNHYANDSWAVSLMSYFHQTENSFTNSSFAYAITPMMADIIAIQNLYGVPDHATGDTTYGRNGDSGTYLDTAIGFAAPTAWTVYDTGGTDHFDFSGYTQNQRLDLSADGWSDLAGLVENIAIARGTVIEAGTTGLGNDSLIGNGSHNTLSAGSGNDDLSGGAGRDLLIGEGGADVLSGGSDGDVMFGDGVTLAELQAIFPSWVAPSDAQARLDAGQVHLLWADIQSDVFGVA